GRCEGCGGGNTIVEEGGREAAPKGLSGKGGRQLEVVDLTAATAEEGERRGTGIAEVDRVTGGGLVPGSAPPVGGGPGSGTSTPLLQVAAAIGAPCTGAGHTAYISGEEAVAQIKLRARRLGLATPNVHLAAATSVRDILASLDRADTPEIAVIDSIQ